MDISSYISSGILELYVLGQLSPEEMSEVEAMQEKHPEIRREIHEISLSLEKYGQLSGIKAPEAVVNKLFQNLPKKTPSSQNSNIGNSGQKGFGSWKLSTLLLGLTSALGFLLYFQQESENRATQQKYEIQQKLCDSIANQQQVQFALLNQINDSNNKIISITPTSSYDGVMVYLHHNVSSKKNFLQLVNLPEISTDQAFQLWSLKGEEAPIPLDIFVEKNTIIPVNFVDNTVTYAITIEPRAGSQTPSLDKLIGTMGVM